MYHSATYNLPHPTCSSLNITCKQYSMGYPLLSSFSLLLFAIWGSNGNTEYSGRDQTASERNKKCRFSKGTGNILSCMGELACYIDLKKMRKKSIEKTRIFSKFSLRVRKFKGLLELK